MKRALTITLLAAAFLLCGALVPKPAHADVGSTVVGRLWDSMINTAKTRLQTNAPTTVVLLEEAEKVYLGGTEDITAMTPIQDVFKAMRVAGLLLLGLCTIISLSQLSEAGLMGRSADLADWIKRFGVATFMTMGGIYFYGIWIRVFNVMLDGFRGYLDTHWTGPHDVSAMYAQIAAAMNDTNTLLMLLFSFITLLVLVVLWFLIGGIRTAELAIAVIIAPLVWPLYLIPALDDVPKSAFRSFLGLNAVLLIVVAMLRLALRMEVGGTIANSVWNFIPAISMLMMTIFLPVMIKRLMGQGNSGTGLLTTAAYALAGLKGLTLMAGTGGAAGAAGTAASPPAAAAIPQAPASPSAYPVAPVSSPGAVSRHSGASQAPPMDEVWATAPRQMHAGMTEGRMALEALYDPKSGDPLTIDLGQSEPGSNKFDTVEAVTLFMNGRRRIVKDIDPK
jgi:hypothetical protein